MLDTLERLKEVTEALEKANIPYMVSGSLLMSTYVIPRFTNDIDIVIQLLPEHVDVFMDIFRNEDWYLDPVTLREEVARKGMFNVIFQPNQIRFDFIVRKDGPFRRHEFERRHRVKIESVEVWGATIEDLVISKLIWIQQLESELQKRDLSELLQAPGLDLGYVRHWIERLGLNTYDLVI